MAPVGMPAHEFSAAILGGHFPFSDPAEWASQAASQAAKAAACRSAAAALREIARTAGSMHGESAQGFCYMLHRLAVSLIAEADDHWTPMARASREIGRLLAVQQAVLIELDSEAHAEIAGLRAQPLTRVDMWNEIWTVVRAATARARTIDSETGARIETALAQSAPPDISSAGAGTGTGASDPVDPALRALAGAGVGGGGTSLHNIPKDKVTFGEGDPPAPGDHKRSAGSGASDNDSSKTHEGSTKESTATKDVRPAPDEKRNDGTAGANGKNPPATTTAGEANKTAPAPGDMARESLRTPTGLSGSPVKSAPPVVSSAPEGGGASSFGPPPVSTNVGGGSSPPVSSLSSVAGSGVRPAGWGGGGGLGGVATPAGGTGGVGGPAVPPPAATSSDFSRGLASGLRGGVPPAAPFAPPVSSTPPPGSASASLPASPSVSLPPPAASGAAAPASGALPAGAPAAGSAPVASPAAAPITAFPGHVGGGVPATPLPPYGSDIAPRAGTSGAPVVTPTTGGGGGSAAVPAAATAGAGGPAGGPVTLPPGVVDAGVGAAAPPAAGAIGAPRDRRLDECSALVYELMHASRRYGMFIDWCVGLAHTRSGPRTLVVSSEGAGYIPRGVFLPRSVFPVFADTGLSPEWRARWFSRSNPAEPMLAYIDLAAELFGAELLALAVSNSYGGSAAPARLAGVAQVEECSFTSSPIPLQRPAIALDDNHVHRLETVDPSLYGRLTGRGGRLPDRSESWTVTVTAADTVLRRVSAAGVVAVPAIIRRVLDRMVAGLPVPAEDWTDLRNSTVDMLGQGSGLRPGRLPGDDQPASTAVRSYHDLARLMELLALWDLSNDDDGPSVKHPEIAYLARHIADTPQG